MESRKEIEKDEQILNLLSNPFMRLYLYVQKALVEDANTGLHTTHNQSKQLWEAANESTKKMSCGTTLRELKLKNKPVKTFTLSVPHVALNLVYT